MRLLPRSLPVFLLLALAACKKDDADSPAAPDPNAPFLDAGATGWERVASIPVPAEAHHGAQLYDLQLANGAVVALVGERVLSPPYPDIKTVFKARLAADGTAAKTQLPNLSPSTHTCLLRPEAFEAYGVSPANGSFFKAVVGEAGPQPPLLRFYDVHNQFSSGNGYRLDATGRRSTRLTSPQVLADGAILYSGGGTTYVSDNISAVFDAEWNWSYFLGGRQTNAYAVTPWPASFSGAPPPPAATSAFRAVRLGSGRIHGVVVKFNGLAIADTVARANQTDYEAPLREVATATFPGFKAYGNLITKVVGNTVLIANWDGDPGQPLVVSGYRWQEGSATIDRLYADVVVPATLAPVGTQVEDYTSAFETAQLDAAGALHFLARLPDANNRTYALEKVDAAGLTQVSKAAVLPAFCEFGALRLLNGQWYTGVASSTGNAANPGHLDVLRLKP